MSDEFLKYVMRFVVKTENFSDLQNNLKKAGVEIKKISETIDLVNGKKVRNKKVTVSTPKDLRNQVLHDLERAGVKKVQTDLNVAKQKTEQERKITKEIKQQILLERLKTAQLRRNIVETNLERANVIKVTAETKQQLAALRVAAAQKREEERLTRLAAAEEKKKNALLNQQFQLEFRLKAIIAEIHRVEAMEARGQDNIRRKNELLAKMRTAYARVLSSVIAYRMGIQTNNRQMISNSHFTAMQYIHNFNAMRTANTSFANNAVRSSSRVRRGIGGIINTMNRLRQTMWSLNSLGHFVGLYAAFSVLRRIGREAWNLFKGALEYADQMNRSKSIFEQLAVMKENKSIIDLERSNDKKDIELRKKAEAFSGNMVDMIRKVSAETGQNMSELMGVTKTILPDLMNKYKGHGNMLLDQSKKVQSFTEDYLKLTAVMRMVDPQNKKLSWHAYSIMEALTGSIDDAKKKKDATGSQNFLSMLRREGIRVLDSEKMAITKSINAGDYMKAMEEVKKTLKRSGIDAAMISVMKTKTLQPNIDGVVSSLKYLGNIFIQPAYNNILKWFKAFNIHLKQLIGDDKFMAWVKKLGESFNMLVTKVLDNFSDKIDYISQSENFHKWVDDMTHSISLFGDVLAGINGLIASFFYGLLGMDSPNGPGKGLEDFLKKTKTALDNARSPMFEFGSTIRGITTDINDWWLKMKEIKAIMTFDWSSEFNPFYRSGLKNGNGLTSDNIKDAENKAEIMRLRRQLLEMKAMKEKSQEARTHKFVDLSDSGSKRGNTVVHFNINGNIQVSDVKDGLDLVKKVVKHDKVSWAFPGVMPN